NAGRINDASLVQNAPDQPGTTTFTLPVNITSPTFGSLVDLDVGLSILHPHLNQLRVVLVAPNGNSIVLFTNKTNTDGNDNPNPGGGQQIGLPNNNGPNSLPNPPGTHNFYPALGTNNGFSLANSNDTSGGGPSAVMTVFDDQAARSISDLGVAAPYISHF